LRLVVRGDKYQTTNKAKHFNSLDLDSFQFSGYCLEFLGGMLEAYYFKLIILIRLFIFVYEFLCVEAGE
jgi:hypothetical protein